MFAIVTDTSANLDCSLLQQRNIAAIPFTFFVGGQEQTCTNTAGFDGPAFYSAMRSGTQVKTSQVSPQQYIDLFSPMLAMGQEILFVGMSSGISGSYHSAEIAVQQLKEVFPDARIRLVDTLGASLGEGLLVLEAADCRDRGMTLDETADRLMAMRHRMAQVFTVEDLKYLRRTGRLSNVTALVGMMLNIKPLLKGDKEGKIVTFARTRGRRQSIQGLAERYDALVRHPEEQMVGIAHADCPEDAETLASLLRAKHPPKEIMTVCYEPVTGSHVGPGTLALFFLGDEDVREKLR